MSEQTKEIGLYRIYSNITDSHRIVITDDSADSVYASLGEGERISHESLWSESAIEIKLQRQPPAENDDACEKPKFDRHEIFVIKACKGHFNAEISDAYANARKLIENLVFTYSPLNDFVVARYLRELLLKTVYGSSLERWEEFTENAVAEAYSKDLFRDRLGFTGRYLLKHYNAVRSLRCANGNETLIDLSISEVEEKEIKHALESARGGE